MAEKTRSRNYPAFGLPDAIQKVKQLWERDGKSAVDAEVAVKAWGYKSINGASLRALAGVRQYGLLDSPEAKVVKVSPTALTIILEPEGSEERDAAIREAAESPSMFQEILGQYPDDLPSDPAVVSWLVRTHNFSETAAKSLIASYRETMALVKRLPKPDIEVEGGSSDDDPNEAIRRTMPGAMAALDRSGVTRKSAPLQQGGVMQFQLGFPDGAQAVLSVPRALDLDDIEILTDWFENAKRMITKAANRPAPSVDGGGDRPGGLGRSTPDTAT